MSKLHLDELAVESFVTSDGSPADLPAAQTTLFSDGYECSQTLNSCKCNTPAYNCV